MNIIDLLNGLPKYQKVFDIVKQSKGENICINNCATSLARIIAADTYIKTKKNIIYTCDNLNTTSRAYEVFCDLVGADNVSFFPVEEFVSTELIASSYPFRLARMMTLYNLLEGNNKIIVTCFSGLARPMMSKERIKESIIHLKVGQIVEISKLVSQFYERGYKRVATTDEMGTFSVRGSVVDIYPINSDCAYRIDFFDNEIDVIKKINIETQMSIEKINEVEVFPLYDIYYSEEESKTIISEIQKKYKPSEKIDNDIKKILEYSSIDQLYMYLPIIDKNYTFLNNIVDNSVVMYENINDIRNSYKNNYDGMIEYYLNIKFNIDKNLFKTLDEVILNSETNVFLSNNLTTLNNIKLNYLDSLNTTNCFDFNNNMKLVIESIKIEKDKKYILTATEERRKNFICEVLNTNNIDYEEQVDFKNKKTSVVTSENAYGFVDFDLNIEILSPNEYAPSRINRTSKYQKYYKNSTKIYNKDEISIGDYVVHQDYGIGLYKGIVTKEIRGNKNDYLYIQYGNDEKLFIPVENIYLIEKYLNNGESIPKLNTLNGKEWQKKKAAVKEKVIDVAKRLIKIQAERELRKGYVYSKDTDEQLEFENDFEYQETEDQIRAINDVKNDMESTKPVDRLICGDVGFGKTEVAMRAAFKAVMDGKQVVYLAPTTILTRQHYYTFRSRFEKYGIRVELLNRFVPKKTQTDVIKGVSEGYVDILIGTHRILSNDIKYKNLGLLIIDEEQRFGVTHKERIKEIKANVDVLTLTATPIPRTLQMSLSGLKDLSIIETAPENRLPIQTYVLEENDAVIRDAINREIGRNGQVFYLLNRIDELDRVISKLHNLVPEAKITMIHGRMDKEDIESQLIDFLDNRYNVLVCTTIIETGIDIPNANTLIIERADILGLSQLYQIRGRIGRSDRLSYAYLMYKPDKTITEAAIKRLEAIKEFTSLGSGYKIATRDLAIRGAGNILGDEQSGFIDSIGMDLYMKLLNEAINELKGTVVKEEPKKFFNISIGKHIDTSYVGDDEIRIEMHKDINKINSREKIQSLIDEYTDRYGKLDNEIILYMYEKYLEFLLKSKGVERFTDTDKEVKFNFDSYTTAKFNFKEMGKMVKQVAPEFDFDYIDKKLYVIINPKDFKDSYIFTLINFLENVKTM